ncbi:hypothetical protein PO909_031246 [Leuciscus waleckii]
MSYRVPEHLQESLKKEVDLMLRLGIIEPSKSDLTDRLGNSKFLMTIVLSKGYWQIPLTRRSRELTTFKSPLGLFHFKVLPFGLHGAPASFQRLMDQTDASDRGLGAVLLQGVPDARRPIAFLSRKLFPREVRYSIVEKECLAVKWALDSLKYDLLGREFVLETGHKALQWLQQMKDTNSRITRCPQ